MQPHFIITISREFGTGGRKVAEELSKLLNVKLYDRRMLKAIQEQYNLTEDEMNSIKARKTSWWDEFTRFYNQAAALSNIKYYQNPVQNISSVELYNAEERILKALAEHESCIILGRTGFHIFRNEPDAFKIFLIADIKSRRDCVARRLNINEGSADQLIREVDEARENYTKAFADSSRYDARHYDLVLNVTGMQPQDVALFIAQCIKRKFKI